MPVLTSALAALWTTDLSSASKANASALMAFQCSLPASFAAAAFCFRGSDDLSRRIVHHNMVVPDGSAKPNTVWPEDRHNQRCERLDDVGAGQKPLFLLTGRVSPASLARDTSRADLTATAPATRPPREWMKDSSIQASWTTSCSRRQSARVLDSA